MQAGTWPSFTFPHTFDEAVIVGKRIVQEFLQWRDLEWADTMRLGPIRRDRSRWRYVRFFATFPVGMDSVNFFKRQQQIV